MQSSGSAVDRIRPITLLGEGRSGQVFVGLDDVLRRRVVVKRLASGSFPSAATRNRLIAEARILSRIDHPGVPRIYDYAEQNEHDVFAIEFTEGPRLRDALAEGLDFAEKVRIATAVASALVVVHRNGVVHGALSPDSVAISKKGEVKIVDFHSTSVHLDGARSDPRWRSPEEAAGAEPTRESDMYCFGLLLQEMFGARDHDLRVLTASLLREAPSDRFTAAAALRRLQRLAGRRARRFRAAAIALLAMLFAFGGTKYTIDLQNERKAALAAQADAEQRRAQANDLVGFIIADIRPKLLSVGKLEIMEATSNKAFAYFGSIGPDEISPAEAAVNVRAFVQFTETEMLKNDLPAAEQSIRQGIALADAVLRRHPEAVELLFTRGTAHALYAMALDRKGDIPQAFVHARAFAETSNEVARRDPGNTNYVWHQAAAYSLLGTLYDRTGDIDASLRNIEISIDRQRQLLAVEGNDVARAQFFKT
ncbi:MAG TPA: protein kinase, partial [Thermoanaerobaculia bacterium]